MTRREQLIEALENASDIDGIIRMSTDFRDILVEELESSKEKIILRLTNWVKLTLKRLKS